MTFHHRFGSSHYYSVVQRTLVPSELEWQLLTPLTRRQTDNIYYPKPMIVDSGMSARTSALTHHHWPDDGWCHLLVDSSTPSGRTTVLFTVTYWSHHRLRPLISHPTPCLRYACFPAAVASLLHPMTYWKLTCRCFCDGRTAESLIK